MQKFYEVRGLQVQKWLSGDVVQLSTGFEKETSNSSPCCETGAGAAAIGTQMSRLRPNFQTLRTDCLLTATVDDWLVARDRKRTTVIYGIIAKTKVVIGASQPEARSAEGCDASRSPPLVEAMTPFHTTNARVWKFLFLCYKSRINVYRNEGHEQHQRKKKGERGSDHRGRSICQCSIIIHGAVWGTR